MNKHHILAIAAHPDDIELCCAGTLALLSRLDLSVAILDLTRGEMGTRGTPELRVKEAEAAAKIIGASRYNLGLPDTMLENKRELQKAIIKAVRLIQPEICFINAENDRHPDHGHAHKLTIDALFYSGLEKIETSHNNELLKPWRPSHIFSYMQDTPFEPDLVLDISDTMDVKIEAILAFESQFNVKPAKGEKSTYISDPAFLEMIKSRARIYGHQIGAAYGEPFKYLGGPIPLKDLSPFLSNKRVR